MHIDVSNDCTGVHCDIDLNPSCPDDRMKLYVQFSLASHFSLIS